MTTIEITADIILITFWLLVSLLNLLLAKYTKRGKHILFLDGDKPEDNWGAFAMFAFLPVMHILTPFIVALNYFEPLMKKIIKWLTK